MSTISSFQSDLDSGLSSNIDETEWVVHIQQTLEEEVEEENELPVSIFCVPKILMLSDPISYIPQQVAIGPYHCFHPELHDMERYKLAAAKRCQRDLSNKKIHDLVNQYFCKVEPKIRACYHKPLKISIETLAWMMAVDASFLFDFLQIYATGAGKKSNNNSSRIIDLAPNKAANDAILRDIIMVENQIPLFVLGKFLEFQFSSLELADEWLFSMLLDLSKELSPFKLVEEFPKIQVKDSAHILDFAYQVIVPKIAEQPYDPNVLSGVVQEGESKKDENDSLADSSYVKQLSDVVWKIISRLDKRPVKWIQRIIFSRPLKVLVKLPWTIITKIPVLKMLKEPVEQIFSSLISKEGERKEGGDSNSEINKEKSPLIQEIAIPSVIDLSAVGVCFFPTNEGIQGIRFDQKTATLHLPIIDVDLNSEITLRNLVAYEACRPSGPLVLGRYTELMNGIIDTEKDAKFLRERKIIINHLKSDKEVADLWNGMSKSIRLTKVPFVDSVIGDVNKYYNGRWRVKSRKFMKKYVFASWQILTLLATIFLLLLMSLQAFCEVYSCRRIFWVKALEPMITG